MARGSLDTTAPGKAQPGLLYSNCPVQAVESRPEGYRARQASRSGGPSAVQRVLPLALPQLRLVRRAAARLAGLAEQWADSAAAQHAGRALPAYRWQHW